MSKKNHGGARPNSGPKTERRISRTKPVYLFTDQLPITSAEVRTAVDKFLNRGNPKKAHKMDELEIEIRETGISIQGAGIGNDPEAAREILQTALDALDSDREREVYGNEIVVKK